MSKATIKDVALAAGVGLGTASRALSQSGSVAETTRRKVLDAAERLQYRPNMQAQALRSARTATLALLIPDVRNQFFAELAHAFEQEVAAEGYTLLLGNANEDAAQQDRFLDAVRRHQVDGLALAPQGGSRSLLRSLVDDEIPAVFVDRWAEGFSIPAVTSDPVPGIHQVVDHLVERSHERIGYIAGPQTISTGRERLDAWRSGLEAHGRGFDEDLVFVGDFQQESGRVGAQRLMDAGVTALFAADSPMALGALEACHTRGVRIGVDVDVIGFDDLSLFQQWIPALTTVSQDVAAMGRHAARMLLEVIAQRDPDSVRLPTHLIERDSTHFLTA